MSHPWLKYKPKTAKDFLGMKFRLDISREPQFPQPNRVSVPILLLNADGKVEKTNVEISDIAFSILMRNINEKTDEKGNFVAQVFTFEHNQKNIPIIMEVKP